MSCGRAFTGPKLNFEVLVRVPFVPFGTLGPLHNCWGGGGRGGWVELLGREGLGAKEVTGCYSGVVAEEGGVTEEDDTAHEGDTADEGYGRVEVDECGGVA
ncbi:uncharacterized protein A4U43_C05F18540 [Asparagus officinalis]|uniref:Uncharacterized protein n=1 Tax=Asparagus officinalis TaxID=4686 RepID=A0A5P1EWG7_ASPOF|nr:uncharacterized protein A4U43_C05F18540 [Asparagus officinalis]